MPLNVISSASDPRILQTVESKRVVSSRTDLEQILEESVSGTTLDLSGHSLGALLQIGNWVIDASAVSWFRMYATALRRFEAVRLIGCHTADSAEGRRVICDIADVLGIEVFGSTGFIFHYHYTKAGFDPAWRFLLSAATELRYREETQRNPIS